MSATMQQVAGSFRDSSGYVFVSHEGVFRTINQCYSQEWSHVVSSGLIQAAIEQGQIIPFEECPAIQSSWKTLRVERFPFISYPYEWCFSQLKDAALLTLSLQKKALEHDCVLKDASAFNIQFRAASPVFIDILSFERWRDGMPWQAYRQFCSHFLAPLALMSRCGISNGRLSQLWIDGVPLETVCAFLPWRARLTPGLLMHLYLHASMQARHADGRAAAKKIEGMRMSKQGIFSVADSLEKTVSRLQLPKGKTEWSDYYQDTNYSEQGTQSKAGTVARWAKENAGNIALDLGANTGLFSREMAPYFSTIIAADYDPLAVEEHYKKLRGTGSNIMPLVLDLANPSPGLGWACTERESFAQRVRADFLTALALCHHLVITAGIPLDRVASYFASLLQPGGAAVVEFVPKGDSQVQRLLAAREDVFPDYTLDGLRKAFISQGFLEEATESVSQSLRTLHLFRLIK